MDARHRTTCVVAAALALVACSSDDPQSAATVPPTTTSSVPVTPAATAATAELFSSTLYAYVVNSADWQGNAARSAWDGTGAPGSGDAFVDVLFGPDGHKVWAVGKATTTTLDEFVAASRSANAAARQCDEVPEATSNTTVDGEPAVLDESHCNGVFALSASVLHAGNAYTFFTFEQPGNEAAMRDWFTALLQHISFEL